MGQFFQVQERRTLVNNNNNNENKRKESKSDITLFFSYKDLAAMRFPSVDVGPRFVLVDSR